MPRLRRGREYADALDMYLVHAELRPNGGRVPPEQTARLIFGYRHPDDGIEHVVFHPDAPGSALVGLFAIASSLEEAERMAAEVCRRALDSSPELHGFSLGRCEVRLVPVRFDQEFYSGQHGRDMPWPD